MANFDTARAALDTSLNSSGSAMEEHAKWSESLEARLNRLKAAWQSLSQTFMNSSFLKVSMDAITGLVNVIDKLLDSLGSFGTIGLGVGIYSLIKSGGLKTFFKSLSAFSTLIPTFNTLGGRVKAVGTSIGDAGRLAKASMGSFSAWTSAIGIAVTVVSALYNAYKNAKEAAAEARQEAIQASDEYLDAASTFEQAYIKYSGRTDLTLDEEEELASAINGTVDALGDKSSALQSIVTSSNDYLASLEAIKKAELESAKNAAEEKQEKVAENLREAAIGWESWDGSEVDIRLGGSEAANIAEEIGGNFFKAIESEITGPRGEQFKDEHYKLELSGDADASDMVAYYNTLLQFKEELKDAGLEESADYANVKEAIDAMADSIGSYVDATYEAVKANYQLGKGIPTTVDEYIAMREAILSDSELDSFSVGQKMSILNSLDSEYRQLFDLSSVEAQARKFVGIIKGYGDGTKDGVNEIGTVETFLNMRTAVNNNECTVGQYLSELNNVKSMSAKFSDEEQKEFNLAFGIDTDAIKEQYDNVYNYLSRNYLNKDTRTMDRDEERYYKLDVREYQKQIREFLNTLSSSELAALVSIKPEIDWENATEEEIRKLIEERVKIDEALSFKTDIEVDTTALETLNTALTESASAIGLTEDSIDSLKSKYSNLEGYNPHTLFEKTANGVKLNRDEVAKLEKKYNDLKKTEVQEHLDTLVSEYNKCTEAIDSNIGSNEKLELISKREKYAEQIQELAEYQAQLEGVTGAYQRWIDAQAGPEDYEGYQAVATGRKDVADEIKRGFISNASKEYIDLLSGKDLQGGTIDDYANAWEKLDDKVTGAGHSIVDFFTVNDDGDITATGIDRFFKSIQTDFKGSIAEFDKETGKWQYNFSHENLQKIQDEWGIGIDAIELLLEAAQSAGYDVDWDGIFDDLDIDTSNFENVEAMISLAEKAQEEFNKLKNVEDVEFNFRTNNIQDATTEVEKARKAYVDLITNDDGTINLKAEGAEQMRFMLSTLLTQKQQLSTPAIMKVDTSQIDKAETDIIDVINQAQTLQTAYENYEIAISTGVDVETAKKDLNSAIEGMQGTSVDVRADLKLPTDEELETAKGSIGDIKVGATLDGTAIGNLATQIQTECTPEIITKVTGLDESVVTSESHQVVYTAEHTDVDNFINGLSDISKKIIYSYTTEGKKPDPSNIRRTITYEYKTEGEGPAAGTAHASGTTSGRAFARGSWGIKGNGVALGGELGRRNCDHT